MEAEMALPVPEGQEPNSAIAVVAKVLTKECPSSTFLKNVGLQSCSKSNNKSNADASAQVVDLEERLGRSQQQAEEMREELAAMKKKTEEAEAAQDQRDKEYHLLLKRTEEYDARFEHIMALLRAKGSG
jgi:TolA-binding protein